MAQSLRQQYPRRMPHRKDGAEEWAIAVLQQIVDVDKRDRDALPGTVVKKVKECITVMKKRRR